jgi:hypothetical protein
MKNAKAVLSARLTNSRQFISEKEKVRIIDSF